MKLIGLQALYLILIIYCSCFILSLDAKPNNLAKSFQPRHGGQQPLDRKDALPRDFDPYQSQYYSNEQEPPEYDEYRNRKTSKRRRSSVVSNYTKSTASKALVATSAAISGAFMAYLLQTMILSKSINIITIVVGVLTALFVFMQGDYGDFARSLGVFTIILSQQTSFTQFIPDFIKQLQASLTLSPRKPFPPAESPWSYKAVEEGDVDFSMLNTLLTLVVLGGMLGWSVVKPIPLFPSWLGAILVGSVVGYSSTFADSRGDLLRFVGFTVLSALAILLSVADDVELKGKISTILGQLLFLFKGIDQQLQLTKGVKYVLGKVLVQATALLYSMKTQEEEPAPKRQQERFASQQRPRFDAEEEYYGGRRERRYRDEEDESGRYR